MVLERNSTIFAFLWFILSWTTSLVTSFLLLSWNKEFFCWNCRPGPSSLNPNSCQYPLINYLVPLLLPMLPRLPILPVLLLPTMPMPPVLPVLPVLPMLPLVASVDVNVVTATASAWPRAVCKTCILNSNRPGIKRDKQCSHIKISVCWQFDAFFKEERSGGTVD